MIIAFRVDTNPHRSPSRLRRSLALASGFRETLPEAEITFLLSGPESSIDEVKAQGYGCRHLGQSSMPSWNAEATAEALDELKADALVVDDEGIDERYLREMRQKAFVFAFDDSNALQNFQSNALINPNIDAHMREYKSEGPLFLGTEFSPIGREFDEFQDAHNEQPQKARRIFVHFPGSDRKGATLDAVRMLKAVKESFIADVFVGRDFSRGEELAGEIGLDDRFVFMNEGPARPRRMSDSDLAIVPPDTTFHEMMMLGVPCCLISQPECPGQDAIAEYAGMQGFALYLGQSGAIGGGDSERPRILSAMISDLEGRKRMALRSGGLVDGLGRFRLATELLRVARREI
jgi:spore coat polysaccharide biosynthesis predicted glycosyltransferase SpsG